MLLKILSEKGMFKNNMILTCLQKNIQLVVVLKGQSYMMELKIIFTKNKNYFYYLI